MTTLRALGAVDTALTRATVAPLPDLPALPPTTSIPSTSTPSPPPETPKRPALETATPTHIGPVTNAPHAIAVPIALLINEQVMIRRPRSTATPLLAAKGYPVFEDVTQFAQRRTLVGATNRSLVSADLRYSA
jgi:hypothetical protein